MKVLKTYARMFVADLDESLQQPRIAAQQPQRSTTWERLTVNHSSNE